MYSLAPMSKIELDPTILVELAETRMPFGRYKGRLLMHLPEPYLVWFAREGLPPGKLGRQLALVLELKTHGLEHLIAPLLPRSSA